MTKKEYDIAKLNNLEKLVREYEIQELYKQEPDMDGPSTPMLVSATWDNIISRNTKTQAIQKLWEEFPVHMHNIREYNAAKLCK